jgi:hypothetical protein
MSASSLKAAAQVFCLEGLMMLLMRGITVLACSVQRPGFSTAKPSPLLALSFQFEHWTTDIQLLTCYRNCWIVAILENLLALPALV